MTTRLWYADCKVLMGQWEEGRFDAIVTDPPYGLEFMGKEWDKLASISSTLEDKDPFAIQRGNSLPFGGGGKRVSYGKDTKAMQDWHHSWATQAYRVLKPGGHALVFGGTRTHHRLMCALEDAGFEIRDVLMWVYGSGFPKSMDISKQIDKAGGDLNRFADARKWLRDRVKERGLTYKDIDTALGNPNSHKASHYLDNSQPLLPTQDDWTILKTLLRVHDDVPIVGMERAVIGQRSVHRGVAFSSDGPDRLDVTLPATDAAKQWEGWGTALKPAYEPIILCRKPISEKNVALNVLRWGVGGLNIDECRVGEDTHQGRFPANLIHDGSEEALSGFPGQNGDSPARFFYCAKASKSERGEGNKHPTVKPLALMRYLCRLITPPDGLILDPFTGSGTTILAAIQEGFNIEGIEQDQESFLTAHKRLEVYQ